MSCFPEPHEVQAAGHRLGRPLADGQARRLAAYLSLLVKWNSRMNLVGPSRWEGILEDLIQDSWHLADLLQTLAPQPEATLDLGAGAGLPGIPLRIFWTSGQYHLVEPRQKRALFMEQAVFALDLPRTAVCCGRMEMLPESLHNADLLLSRAFRPWKALLRDVRGLLAPGGRVVIMSNDARTESVAGYELETVREYIVAGKKRFFRLFVLGGEGFG